MLAYDELMNKMYSLAEQKGQDHLDEAWLVIEDIHWPNPHYNGEPVAHPESDSVFNPPIGPSVKERYKAFLAKQGKS